MCEAVNSFHMIERVNLKGEAGVSFCCFDCTAEAVHVLTFLELMYAGKRFHLPIALLERSHLLKLLLIVGEEEANELNGMLRLD